jgi:hypothetical protein
MTTATEMTMQIQKPMRRKAGDGCPAERDVGWVWEEAAMSCSERQRIV